MGSFFRRANREEVVRFETPDQEDFIEVRAELTKSEANKIMSFAPSGERDVAGGLAFIEKFFQTIIVSWSVTDDEGNPVLPTVEAYRELESVGARWIDEQLTGHLRTVLGTEVEELETEAFPSGTGSGDGEESVEPTE